MNKICLINGSSKNNGASYKYLNILKKKLKSDNTNFISTYKFKEDDINLINECDIIIFSFPLYVDALPAHFLNFLIIFENIIRNKNIYVISNCGFIEGIHNKVALEIIENYCIKNKNNYMGGIGIGGGPIGFRKYPIINFNIKKNLKKLAKCINKEINFKNKFTKVIFPRFLYVRIGNHNFSKEILK